jgi:hypothetical protein
MDADSYAAELVKVCLEQDIKIIGIADHGDVSEVDLIREKLSKEGIIVFPALRLRVAVKSTGYAYFPKIPPPTT